MCCILPPGRSREGGRTRKDVNNTRSRLGKASVRAVANTEEVWEENRTERANIPFTSEMKFCLRCHILFQVEDIAATMPVIMLPDDEL